MILKIVEGLALVLALVFGFLWYLNPEGAFEALSFISLLLGVTITDYIRRHIKEKNQEEAYEILLSELSRLFENKIHKTIEEVSSNTESNIKRELSGLFPKSIKEAIELLAKANVELSESKSNDKSVDRVYPVRSLAEAYGVENSAYQIGEMSIYEAKGNRAKSKKNA